MHIVIADSMKEGMEYAKTLHVPRVKGYSTKTEGWRGMCWRGGDVVYVISKKREAFESFTLCFKGCQVFYNYLK